MKVNGQSVFSTGLEQIVDSLSFVRTGRSVAFQAGKRIIVLAETNTLRALLARTHHQRQVADALVKSTGVAVSPHDILFIRYGQIDKTSSGKLRRHSVAERFRNHQIRTSDIGGYLVDRMRVQISRVVRLRMLRLGNTRR